MDVLVRQESPPRHRALWVLLGAVALAVALVGAALVQYLVSSGRPVPPFPSLADRPDPALHGTVAYYADASRCVRVVAAAGRPSKQVFCLPEPDPAVAKTAGKEVGPQLVWRSGGRLEVTVFRMSDPAASGLVPVLHPGWQRLVDVRTGAVSDVPAARVPSAPDLGTRSAVDPSGRRLVTSSDPATGRVRVRLVEAGRTRTLLAAQGPGEHTYGLLAAFWSPDARWVAVDDGRLLVLTTGEPPVARVLTDESRSVAFGGDDPRISRFAVTAADLLR